MLLNKHYIKIQPHRKAFDPAPTLPQNDDEPHPLCCPYEHKPPSHKPRSPPATTAHKFPAPSPVGLARPMQDQTQPVGFGRPAILHACFAGPYGKSV